MADCIKCGEYTKFNGGLCYSCYKIENGKENSSTKTQEDKNFFANDFSEKKAVPNSITKVENVKEGGLNDKDRNYRYNMIKGRIAETLIQELFLSLGYNVFRYGMENTIPGIIELLKGVKSEVATEIKRMPDFVVQSPKTSEVFFVEVKFRKSGEFALKDLPTDYPYGNAYIILVSKKHIKCISVKELNEGGEISTTSRNYLGNRKEFELDKNVIIDFCQFAIQFFENVE